MIYYLASLCTITLLPYQVSHCLASSYLSVTGFAYPPPPPHFFAKETAAVSSSSRHDGSRRRSRLRRLRPQQRPQNRHVGRDQRVGGAELAMAHPTGADIVGDLSKDGVTSELTSKGVQSENIWDVYVLESSKKSNEKGTIPISSLIQAFISLAPSSDDVAVYPAVFHKQNKQKGKGYSVRCIQRKRSSAGDGERNNDGEIVSALEIGNVDSVDKVYRIMTEHLNLGEINPKACECMKCYFEGNRSLQEGEPSQAITLYGQALSAAERQPSQPLPKGSILMKRARAYLKRASNHRDTLRTLVKDLADTVPSASTIKILYQTASAHPAISNPIFNRLALDSKVQQAKFRQIRYRHDMYEFALLHAAQDSLQSTQILPRNAEAWLLAGECLAELRKLKESNQYYQRALETDPGMELTLKGVMEKNRVSQEFMDVARASGEMQQFSFYFIFI